MNRCDSCGTEATVVDPNGDGITCGCAMSNPLERAAIALFNVAMDGLGWPSKQWDDPALDQVDRARENFRDRARTALTAAIDVDELAEHIGMEHAQTVRNHLLGATRD